MVSAKVSQWLKVLSMTVGAFSAAYAVAAAPDSAGASAITVNEWIGILLPTLTTFVNGIQGAPKDAREPGTTSRVTD